MAEDAEQRTKITQQVKLAAKELVTRKMIENWENLAIVMPELKDVPVPTVAQMMGDPKNPGGIAEELIQKRKYEFKDKDGKPILKDGKPIVLDLADLDARIDKYVKEVGPAATMFRSGVGRVNQIVPTQAALDEITEASLRGIKSQTGGMNTVLNFLQAAFTWILSAIGSLFSGEKSVSFGQAMGDTVAPGIRDAVKTEVAALASNPKSASFHLLNIQDSDGKTPVDHIGDAAFRAAYAEAGGTPPPALPSDKPAPVKLEDVKPTPFTRGTIRTAISNQVQFPETDGKPGEPLNKTILAELTKRRNDYVEKGILGTGLLTTPVSWVAPDNDQLANTSNKIAKIIGDTLAARMTDPKFPPNGQKLSDLTDQQFGDLMAKEVAAELKAQKDQIHLGFRTSITDKIGGKGKDKDKTYLDMIEKDIADRAKARHKELKSIFPLLENLPTINPAAEKTAELEKIKAALTKEKDLVLAGFNTDNNKKISEAEAKAAIDLIAKIRRENTDGNDVLNDLELMRLNILPKDADYTAKKATATKLLKADLQLEKSGLDLTKADIGQVVAAMQANGIQPTATGTAGTGAPPASGTSAAAGVER